MFNQKPEAKGLESRTRTSSLLPDRYIASNMVVFYQKKKKKGQIWGYGGKRTLDIRHIYNSTSLISLERCQASLRSKGVQLSDLQQVQSPRRKLFCKSGCFLINLVYKDKLFLTVRMITRLGFFFSNTDEQ